MNPMRFLEAIGVVERVDFPPELKDVTHEDYDRMATMIATAQWLAHQALGDAQVIGEAQPAPQPDHPWEEAA